MRGLTAVLVLSLVALVEGDQVTEEGDQLSVEELVRLRESAGEERYAFSPRRVVSVEVAEPPVVDGVLRDACWQGLEPITDLVASDTGQAPSQRTDVFVCHRGGVLYVGFRCHEAAMEGRPDPTTPDYEPGDWEQRTDTLELYFSVANDHTDYFRLVIVSSLLERYGVQTLDKATPLILEEIPSLMVDVVGEGDYQPYLEKMTRDLGIESHFNFTGYIRYENVPSYIARADIGIAPMIADVGAPNKLFEYFALGKPSIASAQFGLTEMFNDDCVLYFQPGNERELAVRILELYHSPEKRAALGSHAQAIHDKYRWSVIKQEYLKVYEKLLNERNNGNRSTEI